MQFDRDGCDNCAKLLGDGFSPEDYTTPQFSGMISVMEPSTSWASKWLHLGEPTAVPLAFFCLCQQALMPVTECQWQGWLQPGSVTSSRELHTCPVCRQASAWLLRPGRQRRPIGRAPGTQEEHRACGSSLLKHCMAGWLLLPVWTALEDACKSAMMTSMHACCHAGERATSYVLCQVEARQKHLRM